MRILETPLAGVLIIEPRVHRDARGFFVETYRADAWAKAGIPGTFVQDNHSQSVRGTLRGLHWQWRRPQGKLVRVVEGAIFDVAVDLRPDSPTFGHWYAATLSAEDFRQIYIPEQFAHGFCVLTETAQVEYKCSDFYDPEGEAGLIWNDPDVGIQWPSVEPILSARDLTHPRFVQISGRGPAPRAEGAPAAEPQGAQRR
jgi:dTDP-4-dehydrorhamnose 3,5-epimerase